MMKKMAIWVLVFLLMVYITPIRANAEEGTKLLALTFDDGPSQAYTGELLDGLRERGVRVTFFVLGQNARAYPDLVRRAYEEGHEIGCHSWDHPDLTKRTDGQVGSQISRTTDLLDEICGLEGEYLVRPPYGSTDSRVRKLIGAPLIHWSVDTLDWKLKNEDQVARKIVEESYDGAIILCHDIHRTTIPAALRAVDQLRAEGYEFVTVSELFRRRGVTLEQGVRYFECKPEGTDPGPVPEPVLQYRAEEGGMATVTASADGPVYYSTDGGFPDRLYTGPFQVAMQTPVTAVTAYRRNGSRSALVTLEWLPQETAPREPIPQGPENTQSEQSGGGMLLPLAFGAAAGGFVENRRSAWAAAKRRRRRRARRAGQLIS